jgi:ABC-type multidrug transport system fused ATPase/permease subunit
VIFPHLPADSVFAKIWRVLGPADRRLAAWVLAGMVVGMLTETLSIGAVIPALTLFAGPEAASRSPKLTALLEWFGNPNEAELIVGGLLLLLALYAIKTLILVALAWQQARFLASIRENLSRRLFKTYLTQPWPFFLQRNSAQLIRNNTTEIAMFVQGCTGMLSACAEGSVTLGIAILLMWVEPLAVVVVGLMLAFATWALQATLRERLTRWGKMRHRADGLRVKALQQGITGVREVKVFGRESEFLEHFRVAESQASHAMRMQTFAGHLPRLWYEFLAVAGVAVLGVVLYVQGVPVTSLLPRLGLFAVAAFRLMPSLNRIVASLQSIQYLEPTVNVLASELALPSPAVQPATPHRLPLKHEIRLDGISFSYPAAHRPALRNISLTIATGSSVGLIGESGAGKSTLVDLLLGLLEPDSGRITVDGRDIRTDLRAWQNSIGYVPQAIFLTDDTIQANVAFGLPADRMDGEAVHRALVAAQLDVFVAGLPDGIHTVVGERGVRLSGGQRQRIGIARALYWDPPILVLDEATSALDTATEAGVMAAVNDLHGRKTLIIIAHRMSTVAHCDELFRLSRGALVGDATGVPPQSGQ